MDSSLPPVRPRRRRLGAALLLAAGCSGPPPGEEVTAPPAPGFAEQAAALGACPEGDATWRAALAAAQAEEQLDPLVVRADELAATCAERWEPRWTAGEALLRLGRPAEAQGRFDEGLERARSLADAVGVACGANRMGALAFHAGQLDEGRSYYEEALEAALEADRDDLASFVRNNLAGLLVETGDFPRARRELELAESGLARLGLAGPARGAAFNRAMILLALGDANEAESILERVTSEAEQAEDRRTLDAAAVALGNLHRYRSQWELAAGWYARVSDASAEQAVRAALGLGRVALARGEVAEAAERLDAVAERAGAELALLGSYARVFQADAEARLGRFDEARRRLDRVIAESAGSRETEWLARWTLGRLWLREGRADEALAPLERAVAILDEQSAPLNPLGQGLHFLRLRADPYVDLAVAVTLDAAPGSETRVLEIAGRAQARALRRAVRGEIGPSATVELAALRAALGEGDLLLDYLLGEERGIVLAVTRDEVRALPIEGRAALHEALRAYRGWLRRPAPDDAGSTPDDLAAAAAGTFLRDRLLGPVDDLLAATNRLYVVPDRELALLPFSALPAGPLAGPAGGSEAWLGQRLEVAFLPLAAPPPDWTATRTPVLLGGQPLLLPDSGFDELPWSAFELSRLSELWGDGSRLLSGGDLTLAGLRGAGLELAGTLHLATHAVASTSDPRQCGVILSGGERMGIDEILELRLPSSLVVLSACRTGEGELLPGEGVVGLGWAFLRAGARGIVVSQWSVDDAASARLMVAFHRHLRDVEPVRALALARRELAAESPHPGYWAPFVIVLAPGELSSAATARGDRGPTRSAPES